MMNRKSTNRMRDSPKYGTRYGKMNNRSTRKSCHILSLSLNTSKGLELKCIP
ncbi:hypothetical protein AAJ76_1720002589 [Vairimorpha ceranae]|uniref:Uncharacterized protein n=1 Tax=Vairimorpha ceranae TaxID=40302 RepID=A0A0F9WAH0_9MICR|nr:hypothetical protein AAJ76_1720002589 [Vairimorpha ceranae]KKO73925.1 hypothetical protein AAJ76_1720002589 [Vairimorpha ceranae]